MEPLFAWNEEKNELLKQERGISFNTIVSAIANDGILDDVRHPSPKFQNQHMLYVRLENYVVAVPYVWQDDVRFLKTAYLSRKATRRYLKG